MKDASYEIGDPAGIRNSSKWRVIWAQKSCWKGVFFSHDFVFSREIPRSGGFFINSPRWWFLLPVPFPSNPWKIKVFDGFWPHKRYGFTRKNPLKNVGFRGWQNELRRRTAKTLWLNPRSSERAFAAILASGTVAPQVKRKNWERRWEILENPWLIQMVVTPWKIKIFNPKMEVLVQIIFRSIRVTY